ncbi:MAG: methylenetetrahydrofolate reductase [NAD(P)H] [Sphingomonadaceae bacterium]
MNAQSGDIAVSFEFFPPRTPKMVEKLWGAIETLAPLKPRFVSVTYGAGGTTRELTREMVKDIASRTGIQSAAHLTCVGASRAEIAEIADSYWDAGIRHLVALRGDPPQVDGVMQPFSAHPEGYANAAELVEGLVKRHPFEISVAAYPDVHPEASSAGADLDNLKRKLDAGGSRALTQFFFEAETYLRFRDRAAAAGIKAEIVPGILPVTNFVQASRMAKMCGTPIPDWMGRLYAGLEDRPETRQLIAATVAADLVRALHAEGVREYHIYTLNQAELSFAICQLLGKGVQA